MAPILFECRFFTIYTHGVFVAFSFLLTVPLWVREAGRRGMDPERIYTLGLLLLAFGIVGARALYVLLNLRFFLENPLEIIKVHHGGLAWYGGFAGALATLILYSRRQGWSPSAVLDSVAPFAAISQAVGRIGCFFNGCCYGFPVEWGIYFKTHGRHLFPTQLVDSATILFVAVFLLRLQSRDKTGTGRIAAWYLVASGLQRFLIEFLRADIRPYYFSLSVFQWMALAVMGAGVVWLRVLRCRRGAA